jgi:UDP-N-acetylglucosamine:LPS N-acetylglucosamine transferase
MLLYGFIPGQEAPNVDHVVQAGAGLFEPKPQRIGADIAQLMSEGRGRLAAMADAARRLGRARATHDIVASILAARPG